MGIAHQLSDQPEILHYIQVTRQDLGDMVFRHAWEEGQELTLQQVLKLVITYHEKIKNPAG